MPTRARVANTACVQYAPYLLQAFAARMLATGHKATISRAELTSMGYDVETLVEMIVAYNELPETSRGFVVCATETAIAIERKPDGGSLVLPAPVRPAEESRPPQKPPVIAPPTLMRALGVAAQKSVSTAPAASSRPKVAR